MTNVHPALQAALAPFAPPSERILREWQQHNPFERASVELVREAQKLNREPRQPEGEPAPY